MEAMVVLARSRRDGAYCVAGKAVDGHGRVGAWVRPVVGAAQAAVPAHLLRCADGSAIRVLDCVRMPLGSPVGVGHQLENRQISRGRPVRFARIPWRQLSSLADDPSEGLWLNGSSSGGGWNDRVPVHSLGGVRGSLRLVPVEDLLLRQAPGFEGRAKFRASFSLANVSYDLALTDCEARNRVVRAGGALVLPTTYLCVSLAVPYEGYAYKIAASVITAEWLGDSA